MTARAKSSADLTSVEEVIAATQEDQGGVVEVELPPLASET